MVGEFWREREGKGFCFCRIDLSLTYLVCQFFGLQLDRGNLSNALADSLLDDLGLTTDDYNNVSLT